MENRSHTGKSHRFFLFFLIFLLILAVVIPFFIKGKNGMPLITIEQIKMPGPIYNLKKAWMERKISSLENDKIQQEAVLKLSNLKERERPAIYKWKDSSGVWHFSDHCPEKIKCTEERLTPPMVSEKPLPSRKPLSEMRDSARNKIREFGKRLENTKIPGKSIIDRGARLKKSAEEARNMIQERYKREEEILSR